MIACFAWTNLQLVNISNAKVNLFAGEKADLYIRMGPHISGALIATIKASGIYENVYCLDPVVLSYKAMRFGQIPGFKVLLLKGAFRRAYDALLERTSGPKQYSRALLTWFYAENAFVLDYWRRHTDHLAITLVDEGTGSYCYHKKELYFPMFMGKYWKDRMRRKLTEGPIAKRLSRNIDSICLYRPQYCRPDVDYKKLTLPQIRADSNPVLYTLLRDAAASLDSAHLMRYEKKRYLYFSLFSQEGARFDASSYRILDTLIEQGGAGNVLVKVHTGDPAHAASFARDREKDIFVDREVCAFESIYAWLEELDNKVLVSCASTATLNPKFMFGHEPYVIFTYRLYDTYRQCGVERDDWIANALIDAYEDKSRVMIPNSMHELENMIRRVHTGTCVAEIKER